jgi:tetratricopeptide (TPR) repeat protein
MIRAAQSLEDKDYPTAITILEKGTAAEPRNAEAEAWLGDAYALNNQPDKAIVAYKKALDLDPNLKEAKENLEELQRQPATPANPSQQQGK